MLFASFKIHASPATFKIDPTAYEIKPR